MDKEKILSEKTPTLHLDKTPFDQDNQKKKCHCSRSITSWLLASTLIILIILVILLLLYPDYERRSAVHEEPIDVLIIPPEPSDAVHEEKSPGTKMNPWDFDFLINPINLCATKYPPNTVEYQMDPEVKLLVLVPSAVDHFEERRAIRKTWGSVAEKSLSPMRLAFVLGATTNKTIDDLIHEESMTSRDIIQIDFVDNYQQLTTKSILMLKWVAQMCPHAQYFLKVEDDTFVNIRNIADLLNKEPFISEEKFIGGHVKNAQSPMKLSEMEIFLSVDDYFLEDFPPYASGAYVMPMPTAIDLFGAAKEVEPHFPMEDAFLTGQCAKHSDIPLIHDPSFVIYDLPMQPSWDIYSTLSTVDSVAPDTLESVWNDMTKSIGNSVQYFENVLSATNTYRRKKKSV